MPIELSPVVVAIEHRAWYSLAAAVLTLAIALWRRYQPLVWDRIPRRWQWLPAVLVPAAGAFVHAEMTGLSIGVALAVTLYAMISGGMTAIGLAHTAKRIIGPSEEAPDGTV